MLYCLSEAGISAYRTSLKEARAGIQSRNLEAVAEQTMRNVVTVTHSQLALFYSPGVALSTGSRAHHESGKCLTDMPTGQSDGAILQLRVPLAR